MRPATHGVVTGVAQERRQIFDGFVLADNGPTNLMDDIVCRLNRKTENALTARCPSQQNCRSFPEVLNFKNYGLVWVFIFEMRYDTPHPKQGLLKPDLGIYAALGSFSGFDRRLGCLPRVDQGQRDDASADYANRELPNAKPPLRICQCYGFFRGLRNAPLLAQVGFFAFLGAGAVCLIFAGLWAVVSGDKTRRPVHWGLVVIGVLGFIAGPWSADQMRLCYPYSNCDGKNPETWDYSSSLTV